jgi:hypothetical protein
LLNALSRKTFFSLKFTPHFIIFYCLFHNKYCLTNYFTANLIIYCQSNFLLLILLIYCHLIKNTAKLFTASFIKNTAMVISTHFKSPFWHSAFGNWPYWQRFLLVFVKVKLILHYELLSHIWHLLNQLSQNY